MTPQQKQKIRDEFEKKYPFLRDEGPTDNEIEHFCNEEVADWWLSILDKELEEERERILAIIGSEVEKFHHENEKIERTVAHDIYELIHNKS